MINFNSPALQACIQGTQAEYQGKPAEAARLYMLAWDDAADDFERCVAAHYIARFQETPAQRLRWNLESLRYANGVGDERVQEFYPSLYLNLGKSYEEMGDQARAQRYYQLAGSFGAAHLPSA